MYKYFSCDCKCCGKAKLTLSIQTSRIKRVCFKTVPYLFDTHAESYFCVFSLSQLTHLLTWIIQLVVHVCALATVCSCVTLMPQPCPVHFQFVAKMHVARHAHHFSTDAPLLKGSFSMQCTKRMRLDVCFPTRSLPRLHNECPV